jgi:hypothetical protein
LRRLRSNAVVFIALGAMVFGLTLEAYEVVAVLEGWALGTEGILIGVALLILGVIGAWMGLRT